MNPKVELMLLGAIGMAWMVAAAFFFRFYCTTRDRFFLLFAASFGIEGLNRFALGLSDQPNEGATWLYLVRLFSFALILIAIADKNRGQLATKPETPPETGTPPRSG